MLTWEAGVQIAHADDTRELEVLNTIHHLTRGRNTYILHILHPDPKDH